MGLAFAAVVAAFVDSDSCTPLIGLIFGGGVGGGQFAVDGQVFDFGC